MAYSSFSFAYVCDQNYEDLLLMSVASWRRFTSGAIYLVDLGVSSECKRILSRLASPLTLLEATTNADVPEDYIDSRIRAYCEKARIGLHGIGEDFVFLDSDVIITSPNFFSIFDAIAPNRVLASQSAWDTDFRWTYNESCLPHLRKISGVNDLTLTWGIPNSGVWAADRDTSRTLSMLWSPMFERAMICEKLRANLNPGTGIGDQEFMGLSMWRAGFHWVRLHGSYNMQVHDTRMRWQDSGGGHLFERAEEVKAIHFGVRLGETPHILESMIASQESREFVLSAYDSVGKWLTAELSAGGCVPCRTIEGDPDLAV